MRIRVQKGRRGTLKILWSMPEFGGPWKRESNSACTESVGIFRVLNLDTIRKKKHGVTTRMGDRYILGFGT